MQSEIDQRVNSVPDPGGSDPPDLTRFADIWRLIAVANLEGEEMDRMHQLVEGAIMGLVVGDALGVPAEFMSREELRESPVCEMIGGGAHGQLPGTWSDDTSMTLCTMDSLISNGIDYDDQMQRFSRWLWDAENTARDEVFDVGGTTKHAVFKFVKKIPALECGETAENTCGNGSLMRIIPTAMYLLGQNNACELSDTTAEVIHNTSKCTHAHLKCQVACGIYCSVVFRMSTAGDLKDAVQSGITHALSYYRGKTEFSPVLPEFETLREIELWPEEDIQSGGYVIHTLQAALWCLLNTDTYEGCVLKAVNLGRDTDTTAAVVGALAGMWYGEQRIPTSWKLLTVKYDEIKGKAREFYDACVENMGGKKGAKSDCN